MRAVLLSYNPGYTKKVTGKTAEERLDMRAATKVGLGLNGLAEGLLRIALLSWHDLR